MRIHFVIRFNPLSPSGDQHQISPHHISVLQHIKVIRIWQMINKHELSWCLDRFEIPKSNQ